METLLTILFVALALYGFSRIIAQEWRGERE
jgi:hypothetical protein